VRNLLDTGAILEVASPIGIPDAFDLVFKGDDPARPCRVTWRRLSRNYGEAHIITMPHRQGLPDATIASWGKVALEPLDKSDVDLLAAGKSVRQGILVDFLGQFSRSAREGLPVYRISGGAGFVWAARFDQSGRGALRFFAIDSSTLSPQPPLVSDRSVTEASPSPAIPARAKKRFDQSHGTRPQLSCHATRSAQ
jgi:hypothetical protein